MKKRISWIGGACHRLAYAAAISSIVWVVSVLPLHMPLGGPAFWVNRIFDLPIATASQLFPCNESGVDLWYRIGPGQSSCPHNPGPEFFGNHMRIGVPAYLLVFYLPNLFLAARRWLRRRSAKVASAMALLALTFATAPVLCAGRGPSTPEERQQAVRLVRALEDDPLNKGASSARQWLVLWLTEIPDISVQLCPALLGGKFESNKKYAAELALQQSLSGAAFMIEHPDQVGDRLAVALAGVEGTLKAYESLLVAKPKAHFASLEALLEARSKGTLSELVATNMKTCT